jgi:hypothetical protein
VNNSPLGENSPNLVALNDGDKKSPAFLGRNVQLRFSLAWTVIGQLKMTHFVGSVLLYCEKLFFGGAKKNVLPTPSGWILRDSILFRVTRLSNCLLFFLHLLQPVFPIVLSRSPPC